MDEFQDALAALFALKLLGTEPEQVRTVLDAPPADDERADRLGARLAKQGAVSAENGALVDNLARELMRYCYHDLSTAFDLFGGVEAAEAALGRRIDLAKAAEAATRAMDLGAPPPGTSWLQTMEELPGRYTHVSEHAKGGMGRVLIVSDTNMGREVALKELLPPSEASTVSEESPARTVASIAARFLQEARVTAQLEHPAIVPVYEVGRRRNGTLYYTMKLVRGQTMAKRLETCKTLVDRLELLPNLIDLCQAMAYAHSRGVVHRDLKPSNIMVGEFGETVVLDWGIARVRSEPDAIADDIRETTAMVWEGLDTPPRTAYGSAIGTPHYMSPEQAQGRLDEIDERSDVYSLGVILFELLTGRAPHLGETMGEVIRRVSEEPPIDPLSIARDAPPELAGICRKAMARKRGQRYTSAQEMAEDIRRFQAGLLVKAYAYKPWETLKTLYRRYRTPVNAAAIATAVIVLTFAISFVQILRANEAERAARMVAERAEQEAVEARDAAEREAYTASMRLASVQARDLRFREAANILLDAEEERRGWEWGYLYGDANRHVIELGPHEGFVFRAGFMPNPDRVLALSTERRVHLWDWRNETELFTFSTDPHYLRDAKPAPDGATVAVATGEGRIFVIDGSTGDIILDRIAHDGPTLSVGFDASGEWLFSGGSDGLAKLWRWPALELIDEYPAPGPTVMQALLTPDGTIGIARTEDGRVRAWELASGRILLDTPATLLATHPTEPWLLVSGQTAAAYDLAGETSLWRAPEDLRNPTRVRYSSGGAWAMLGYEDGTVRLLAAASGAQATAYSMGEAVLDFATNADDSILAANSRRGMVRVWDIATGRIRNTMAGHLGGVTRAVPHPTDALLLTGSSDGTARVWLADDERVIYASADENRALFDLARDEAGQRVAVSGYGPGLVVLDVDQRKPLLRANSLGPMFRRAIALSPDGERVLHMADGITPFILSVPDGEILARLETHAGDVRAAAFSPDGALAATGGWDAQVSIWEVATGSLLRRLSAESESVVDLKFFPDGTRLAAALREGSIQIWDAVDGREIRTLEYPVRFTVVAISEDGQRLAAGSHDGDIVLWNLDEEGAPAVLFDHAAGLPQPAGHRSGVRGITFVPGENRLITGHWLGQISIWDGVDGELILSVPIAESNITGLTLLPESGHAVLAGYQGETRLLTAPPRQVAALGAAPGLPYHEAFAEFRRGRRDILLERAGPPTNPDRLIWLTAEDAHAGAVAALQARLDGGPVTIGRAEMDVGAAHLGLQEGDRVQAARLPESLTVLRAGRTLSIQLRPVPVVTETKEIRLSAGEAGEVFAGLRDFWRGGPEAVQTIMRDAARRMGLAPPTPEAMPGFWLIPSSNDASHRLYPPIGLAPRDRITHAGGQPVTALTQVFDWLDQGIAEAAEPTGVPMTLRVERGLYTVLELSITVEP